MASRKQIAAAVLALLVAGGQFPKFGRRLTQPDTAATPGAPALYLVKSTEDYAREDSGTPGVRVIDFLVVIYTAVDPSDLAAIPADVIDDLLDVIDVQLRPGVADQLGAGGRLTLGNLVYDCRIVGKVETVAGDITGRGQTVIPIQVTLP